MAVIVSPFVFLDKKTLLNVERHDMDIFVILGHQLVHNVDAKPTKITKSSFFSVGRIFREFSFYWY